MLLNVVVVVAIAAIILVSVRRAWEAWHSAIPASTRQGREWIPAPELTLPTPRPVRITWQGILIRGCGAIIVSFLLCLWFFIGYTFYQGIVRTPQHGVYPLVAVAIAVAIFVAFGLLTGVVFKSFFWPSMELQLLRRGGPARAVITKVRMLPTISNWWSYRVTFEFRDEVNNETKGSSDWFLSWTPETGDIVTALYDPDDPKRCTLYPARSYWIARPKKS